MTQATDQCRRDQGRAGAVSLAVIRAMVEDATAHGYGPAHRDAPNALGIFASPARTEPATFTHDGEQVTVVPCVSALAVRTALLDHAGPGWLVIVTDRTADDLGAGILAHLAGSKLRTPDPWEAVRQQFAATGLEAALYAREATPFAHGLLAARPEDGWPPAPAAVLTRDHALGAVARSRLEVPAHSLDALGVLRWTTGPAVPALIASLRHSAGDELTDATLDWICAGAGPAAPPVRELIRRGELDDAVPLGLVLATLAHVPGEHLQTAELALARLAHRWGGQPLSEQTMSTWGQAASTVASDLLGEPDQDEVARRLLNRGDQLLSEADAAGLAEHSAILPSGRAARVQTLAHTLRAAIDHGRLDAVRAAWAAVAEHRSPGGAEALRAVHAGVRLVHWLRSCGSPDHATDHWGGTSLAARALRQASDDAWVDAAVNDAHTGVADRMVSEALHAVLSAVQQVRDRHDEEFAAALATATRDEAGTAEGYLEADGQRVWLLEHVLRQVVVPHAKDVNPTLLLVLDGMSTGVATEVVEDIRSDGTWVESLLPGATRRAATLAVLPSLTQVSRASLLSGTLTTGEQSRERRGHTDLTSALGIQATLFHKKPLDTTRAGFALADDVAAAIGDTAGQPLVTCILNTIDDALDRSDPGGITWTTDAVKHLRPLLDQALLAGRTVILTADHGHVVERRAGRQASHPETSSTRSRSADAPAGDGEVLVSGSRVLEHDGVAVLAVNERLRYGPLKAGYHGGASPAEVVVPLVVLTPGNLSGDLPAAPAQKPPWWELLTQSPSPEVASWDAPDGSMLFDLHEPSDGEVPAALGAAVVGSGIYAAQRSISRRVSLTDAQVLAAVDALAAGAGTRLPEAALADVLGVPAVRMRGAIAQLQQVLNVEGYAVLRTEPGVVVLDEALLREQFGVG